MPPQPPTTTFSVVIRTQGTRLKALSEALASVRQQSLPASQTLLVCHDVGEDTFKHISDVAASIPGLEVEILRAPSGERGVPLSVGVAHARGDYILFLDDDDVVLPDWLQAFALVGQDQPGMQPALRAQVLIQDMQVTAEDVRGFSELGSARQEYPRHFDLIDHLLVNRTPFMSFAFPRGLFASGAIAVDEQLQVCEDWDLILQAAFQVPVVDVNEATAIYRRWEQLETSYSRHSIEEWRDSERRVLKKVEGHALALSAHLQRIQELLKREEEWRWMRTEVDVWEAAQRSISWRITQPLRWVRAKLRRK